MLTVRTIEALLPADCPLGSRIYDTLEAGGTQEEVQDLLERNNVAALGDTFISDEIFAALAAIPPPPAPVKGDKGDTGPRGPAGLRAAVGYLAAAVAVILVIFAVIYYIDSKRVDERIDAAKAEMPDVARNVTKNVLWSTFGDNFLAAAPTWAKPAEPKCSQLDRPPQIADCLAQGSVACAMRCCDAWAQASGNLGAFCRIRVHNALGPPAPYPPPPPVSSNQ